MPVRKPEQLETQEGHAPLHTRMEAAKTQNLRLLGRQRETEFLQPLRHHPKKPPRIRLEAEGADEIVRIPAQQHLTPTAGLHHTLDPKIQRMMQIEVSQHGRHVSVRATTGLTLPAARRPISN